MEITKAVMILSHSRVRVCPEPGRSPEAYEELRRLASSVRRNGASPTLNPTALVHEAWLRLARAPDLEVVSEQHFEHLAERAWLALELRKG
jgi:hypothetical protein